MEEKNKKAWFAKYTIKAQDPTILGILSNTAQTRIASDENAPDIHIQNNQDQQIEPELDPDIWSLIDDQEQSAEPHADQQVHEITLGSKEEVAIANVWHDLQLYGLKPGTTNIIIQDQAGQEKTVSITVEENTINIPSGNVFLLKNEWRYRIYALSVDRSIFRNVGSIGRGFNGYTMRAEQWWTTPLIMMIRREWQWWRHFRKVHFTVVVDDLNTQTANQTTSNNLSNIESNRGDRKYSKSYTDYHQEQTTSDENQAPSQNNNSQENTPSSLNQQLHDNEGVTSHETQAKNNNDNDDFRTNAASVTLQVGDAIKINLAGGQKPYTVKRSNKTIVWLGRVSRDTSGLAIASTEDLANQEWIVDESDDNELHDITELLESDEEWAPAQERDPSLETQEEVSIASTEDENRTTNRTSRRWHSYC